MLIRKNVVLLEGKHFYNFLKIFVCLPSVLIVLRREESMDRFEYLVLLIVFTTY